MQEEWKPVKGFEKYYEVNKEGVVRTKGRLIKRKSTLGKPHTVPVKHKIKKPYQTKAGYITVALVIKNKTKNTYLHRIIAEAFIPEIAKKLNLTKNIVQGVTSGRTYKRLLSEI